MNKELVNKIYEENKDELDRFGINLDEFKRSLQQVLDKIRAGGKP